MRVILLALISGLIAAVFSPASARDKAEAACKGTDLLAEMRRQERAVYTGIISQAVATQNTGAILWRVAAPGTATSYLFGTVHLTDDRITEVSPRVETVLGEVSTLAIEIADLSEQATNAAIAEATDVAVFTGETNLKGLLSGTEYADVESRLSAAGMPPAMAASLRPWLVNMILSVSDCERRKTKAGLLVLDAKLAMLARKKNIEVVSLETLSEQLRALAALDIPQQVALLRATLSQAARADDLQETVVQMYTRRRMGAALPLQIALAGKAGITSEPFDAFSQKVLTNRNRSMMDKVRPILERGGAMIAVGALHLSGPDGLVALIRNEGFAVTPIE